MNRTKYRHSRNIRVTCLSIVALLIAVLCLSGCTAKQENIYAKAENWAYLETDTSDKEADAFFICPTVYGGDSENCNMALDDEETRQSFLGATNMEKGIYDTDCRFFAPYYRQVGLSVYQMDVQDRDRKSVV